MKLDRRGFLTGASAALAALNLPTANASSEEYYWQAGYETAPVDGFGPTRMTKLHGEVPTGLKGSLYRNGPAQFHYGDARLEHWFDGDGMVHAVQFEDGAATHTGRFVETIKRRDEQDAQKFLAPGFGSVGDPTYSLSGPDDTNAANTSVLKVGNDLLALWEAGSAFRLDPVSLETIEPVVWRDDLEGVPFLAHPKVSPDGTIWNLAVFGNRVGIYKISPEGALQDFQIIALDVAPYIHDFAVSETKIILLLQPWNYGPLAAPIVDSLQWQPERGLRALIIDKADMSKRRWCELPSKAFFHTGDAYEDGQGNIFIDFCAYEDPNFVASGQNALFKGDYDRSKLFPPAQLVLAKLPLKGDGVLISTGVNAEFPRIDPRYQGIKKQNTWMVDTAARSHAPGSSKIHRMNWDKAELDSYDYGKAHMVEEHVFALRPNSTQEGDGWLIGTTLNMVEQTTEVHILDALNLSAGPIASFRAPYAWPLGFHGAWAPA